MKRACRMNCLLTLILLHLIPSLFAQKSEPKSISVLPSDRWCLENGYYKEKENDDGESYKAADPYEALKSEADLRKAAKALRKELGQKGYETLSAKKVKEGEDPYFKVMIHLEMNEDQIKLQVTAKSGKMVAADVYDKIRPGDEEKKGKALKKGISRNAKELADGMDRYLKKVKKKGERIKVRVKTTNTKTLPHKKCGNGEDQRIRTAFKKALEEHSVGKEVRTKRGLGMGKVGYSNVRCPFDLEKKAFGKTIVRSAKEKCSILKGKELEVLDDRPSMIIIQIE